MTPASQAALDPAGGDDPWLDALLGLHQVCGRLGALLDDVMREVDAAGPWSETDGRGDKRDHVPPRREGPRNEPRDSEPGDSEPRRGSLRSSAPLGSDESRNAPSTSAQLDGSRPDTAPRSREALGSGTRAGEGRMGEARGTETRASEAHGKEARGNEVHGREARGNEVHRCEARGTERLEAEDEALPDGAIDAVLGLASVRTTVSLILAALCGEPIETGPAEDAAWSRELLR